MSTENYIDKKNQQPTICKVIDIEQVNEKVKTFTIEYSMIGNPGQFILLWLPRLGEKPFGISELSEKYFKTTICNVGDFTSKLFELKVNDKIGVRGPLRNKL